MLPPLQLVCAAAAVADNVRRWPCSDGCPSRICDFFARHAAGSASGAEGGDLVGAIKSGAVGWVGNGLDPRPLPGLS